MTSGLPASVLTGPIPDADYLRCVVRPYTNGLPLRFVWPGRDRTSVRIVHAMPLINDDADYLRCHVMVLLRFRSLLDLGRLSGSLAGCPILGFLHAAAKQYKGYAK